MVHGILEEYERGDLAEWELVDTFKERFEREITKEFPWNAYVDLKESYFNDGVRFFENFDGFKNMKVIDAEHEFTDDFDDFRIKGFIDLILEDKNTGEITVQDWKSKAKFKDKEELKKYARQLYLYARNIKNTYGKYPDKLCFGMFRKQKTVEFPFDKDAYEEAENWVRTTVKNIRDCEEYPAERDEFYCKNLCGFSKNCPYAAKEEVSDD